MTGRTARYHGQGQTGTDPYTLRGLLRCQGCEQRVQPHTSTSGVRGYRCLSGCRLSDLNAATLERLVYDATEAADPALAFDVPQDQQAVLFSQVIAVIHVGATLDDFTVTWKT